MFIQLRGSGVGAIAAWTVLVFSLGGSVLAIWGGVIRTNQMFNNAMAGGGATYTQVSSYGPETSWDAEARDITGDSFTVRFEVEIDSSNAVPLGGIVIVLEYLDASERTLEVGEDSEWVLKDEDGKKVVSGDELNARVIDRLFALGGFDSEDELYRGYSDQVYVLADLVISDGPNGLYAAGTGRLALAQEGNDPSMNLTNYGFDRKMGTGAVAFTALPGMSFSVWSPVFYSFVVLLVIYLAGIYFILRRRKKVLRLGHLTAAGSLE